MYENIQTQINLLKKENTYMAFDIIDLNQNAMFPKKLVELWIYPRCAKNRQDVDIKNFSIRIPLTDEKTPEEFLTDIALATKKIEIAPIEIAIEKFCKSFTKPIDKKILIKYLSRWYANDIEKFKRLNTWTQNQLSKI